MNIRKNVLSAVLALAVAVTTTMTANAESVLGDDSGATTPIQDQVTADNNEEPESKGALAVVENPGITLSDTTPELWFVIGCRDFRFNIDYSKVAKLSATFTVIEEDRELFDGQCAGGLSLAINNFDFEEGSELWNKYAWTTQTWWGVSDDELGIDKAVSEEQDIISEKIGDYTYKITSNLFENPLANGDFQRIDFMGFAVQEWGVNKARIKVLSLDVMDESDNVLLTYDSDGNGGVVQSPSDDTSPEEITYNGIKYIVNNDNTLSVAGAEDKDSLVDLVIPAEVDGKTVTELRSWAFNGCSNLKSVTFPNTLRQVRSGTSGIFLECPKLTEFIVDEDNEYFCAEDGILFNKDKTRIERYPSGKTETEYMLKYGASFDAFSGNKFLEKVIIQNSGVTWRAFAGCTNLKTVILLDGVQTLLEEPFIGCLKTANLC